jgi:hypothetical protein
MVLRSVLIAAGITLLAAMGATSPALASSPTPAPAVTTTATATPAFPSSAIWCDGSAYRECINLRGGTCRAGAVVQGWPPETGDNYERLHFVPVEANKVEIQFVHCGSAWCIYHSRIVHGFATAYLGVCDASSGASLWGYGQNIAVWTFNAGGYLTATLSNGNQLITENLLINQAYWMIY